MGRSSGHRETPSIAIVLYDCHVSTNIGVSHHTSGRYNGIPFKVWRPNHYHTYLHNAPQTHMQSRETRRTAWRTHRPQGMQGPHDQGHPRQQAPVQQTRREEHKDIATDFPKCCQHISARTERDWHRAILVLDLEASGRPSTWACRSPIKV